ncbi:hypothetical protein SEA_DATBOI_122 [Gordonia phage DatBoi]|nr:hypothetical protein SEA_DATBOI_122 [Gordonia phage DatBoi]
MTTAACGAACMGQVNSNNFTSTTSGGSGGGWDLFLFLLVVASIIAMVLYSAWEMYR